MLKSIVPSDYIEIDNIVKQLKEKEINLFLYTQHNEGFSTLLNSIFKNISKKNKKIAFFDFNTHFEEKHFFENDKSTSYIKLDNNKLRKVIDEDINDLHCFFFQESILSPSEREDFIFKFKDKIEEMKNEYDYIFISNEPMLNKNKNNLQLSELSSIVENSFFIIRSDYISKIKLENVKEDLIEANIEISGIIINDYEFINLFDQLQRQVNKIKMILPKKIYDKITYILKEFKYSNQL
jgi:cellulose biosynthesis protein BcsQ